MADSSNPYSTPPITIPDDVPDVPMDGPKWPRVVGMTSMIWAGFGVTCNVCGGIGWVMTPYLMSMSKQDLGPLPPTMSPPIAMLGLMVVGVAWAVFLFVGGLMTFRRNPGGRGVHLLYGAGSIILVGVSIYFQLKMQQQMAVWVKDHPDSMFAKGQSDMGNLIGLVFGLVLGLAWPVFCLIWFGMVKTRPEQFTSNTSSAST